MRFFSAYGEALCCISSFNLVILFKSRFLNFITYNKDNRNILEQRRLLRDFSNYVAANVFINASEAAVKREVMYARM